MPKPVRAEMALLAHDHDVLLYFAEGVAVADVRAAQYDAALHPYAGLLIDFDAPLAVVMLALPAALTAVQGAACAELHAEG